MAFNIMSCSGFDTGFLGGCSKAWIGMVILFFVIAIARKWGGEEVGVDFNFFIALAGGFIPYLVLITIFGSFKIALVAGLVIGLLCGYGAGQFIGGSE